MKSVQWVPYSRSNIRNVEKSSFSWCFRHHKSGSRARSVGKAVISADGDLEEDVDTEAISDEIEERIQNLKQDKAKEKLASTRIKNKLFRMLDEQDYPSRRAIKETCQQLGDVQERAIGTMSCVWTEYALLKDRIKRKKSRGWGEQIATRIFGGERESTTVFRVPLRRVIQPCNRWVREHLPTS